MGTLKSIPIKDSPKEQSLYINKNKNKIEAILQRLLYRDKDTRQIVIYLPALNISAYGITEEKALKMLEFSMDEYFNYLFSLPIKEMNEELIRCGWKHKEKYRQKMYSSAYIDKNGSLCGFNAVDNKVEAGVLSY